MEKNGTFFYKERKRTERMERSFEKNGCPTLVKASNLEDFNTWRKRKLNKEIT